MPGKALSSKSFDSLLLEHAINRFGAQCEAKWLKKNGKSNYTSHFLEHGYYVTPLPEDTVTQLKRIFVDENIEPISPSSCVDGYLQSTLDETACAQLNSQNTFYGKPEDAVISALGQYFTSIKDDIEAQIAHGWEISNVRCWAVKPNADYGSNTWHADGFSRYVRKLLVFVNPPSPDAGTIEIATRKNEVFNVEADTPVCLLFDNAMLSHRGRPPKLAARPIIEVTIVPSEESNPAPVFAGQVARVPLDLASDEVEKLKANCYVEEGPKPLRIPTLRQVKKKLPKLVASAARTAKRSVKNTKAGRGMPSVTNQMGRLNIGGGRRWQHKGWINLEGAPGPANPFPFWFSGDAVFPVPSSSIQLVYSSHCLEHLDDATVERALKEARRVLSTDGALVLKLPDCDEALEKWRARDEKYFHESIRFGKVQPTWAAHGVRDTLDNRAAYVFCGFWNDAFGHNFIGKHNRKTHGPDAYNGPPLQTEKMAQDLIALDSPHEIAHRLRQAVIDNEDDYTFNHQNGWGRDELKTLVESCGFRVESLDRRDVIKRNSDVPGIELMEDISVYCHAVPV